MNGPVGVFWAWAPGMPMAAGICRAAPFTNTVRCAWMWNTSLLVGVAADPVDGLPGGLAGRAGQRGRRRDRHALGAVGPGEGSGFSVPSVLSEASLSFGAPPAALAGLPLLLVTARVMATAAMITTTAAPIPASQLRRRCRAASRARISATLARAAAPRALDPRDLVPWPGPAGLAPARPAPACLGPACLGRPGPAGLAPRLGRSGPAGLSRAGLWRAAVARSRLRLKAATRGLLPEPPRPERPFPPVPLDT